jgi:hypothetical protein
MIRHYKGERDMPLLKGKENIGKNIKTEEAAGKPRRQAVAIALKTAGVSKGKDARESLCNNCGQPRSRCNCAHPDFSRAKDYLSPIPIDDQVLGKGAVGDRRGKDANGTPKFCEKCGEEVSPFSSTTSTGKVLCRACIRREREHKSKDSDLKPIPVDDQVLGKGAAGDTDPRKPVYKENGWKVMPTHIGLLQVIHPKGSLVAQVKNLEQAKKYIAANSGEAQDLSPIPINDDTKYAERPKSSKWNGTSVAFKTPEAVREAYKPNTAEGMKKSFGKDSEVPIGFAAGKSPEFRAAEWARRQAELQSAKTKKGYERAVGKAKDFTPLGGMKCQKCGRSVSQTNRTVSGATLCPTCKAVSAAGKAEDYQVGSKTDKLLTRIAKLEARASLNTAQKKEIELAKKAMRTNSYEGAAIHLNKAETSADPNYAGQENDSKAHATDCVYSAVC